MAKSGLKIQNTTKKLSQLFSTSENFIRQKAHTFEVFLTISGYSKVQLQTEGLESNAIKIYLITLTMYY